MKRSAFRRATILIALLGGAALAAGVTRLVTRPWQQGKVDQAKDEAKDEAKTDSPPGRLPPDARFGAARLSLDLPSGSDLSAVGYVVQSPDKVVLARGTIVVPEGQTGKVSGDVVLPVTRAATVSFIGSRSGSGSENGASGDARRNVYLGRATFDVTASGNTEVTVAALDSSAGSLARDNGRFSASGSSSSGAPQAGQYATCESCELASSQLLCDPPNLTATSNMDPRTGEQTGVGWGCGTLPTVAARDACLALLRCLSANDCEKQGQNPVMGCYCGSAPAVPCLSGEGIDGVCAPLYHAAAKVSAEAPAGMTTVAQLSRFIAIKAADPSTPIGLADNLRRCAIDSRCEVCEEL